ncbi:hypothetical protein [Alteribacillus sp. YIM 98480]|uniref:hypothetical protein n=1 Tax=Alteribacillus sp. YIM 98480 TaxID=2606599 RepID=UPI00131B85E1|nr:hypothetical protein [Alteribacillus sp. YIM 98480]
MKISYELLDYVGDADLHTKLKDVEYSTDLREVVTVGFMMEKENEKAPAVGPASA